MKNCGEIIELMSLYIDGELDSETKREFEEHIETCESCRSELYELKEIVDVLEKLRRLSFLQDLKSSFTRNLWRKRRKMNQRAKFCLSGKSLLVLHLPLPPDSFWFLLPQA